MAAPTRLNRAESKAKTREQLIAAAREVFLERGFHAASVADISERAGFTTGAIYSGFGGKDELFLAFLDTELSERALSQRAMLESKSFDEMIRAAARDLHRAGAADPAMSALIVEFWIYATSRPALREHVSALHERQIAWIAEMLRDGCALHGVRLRLSYEDVARGGGALSRGIRLERLLDPAGVAEEIFVEMFAAYVAGLVVPPGAGRGTRKGGRK